MTALFVIEDPEQDGLDARAVAFCAQAVQRGDTRRWAVSECLSCGCECRSYLPLRTPELPSMDDNSTEARRDDE